MFICTAVGSPIRKVIKDYLLCNFVKQTFLNNVFLLFFHFIWSIVNSYYILYKHRHCETNHTNYTHGKKKLCITKSYIKNYLNCCCIINIVYKLHCIWYWFFRTSSCLCVNIFFTVFTIRQILSSYCSWFYLLLQTECLFKLLKFNKRYLVLMKIL